MAMDTIRIRGAYPQPEERRSRPAARQADRDHRPVSSGKSSLAFDTSRRGPAPLRQLSAYARQFLGVEKPDVDHIEGLSPAISIEQKSTSHNPRSTVGTITEIYDYLRPLYATSFAPLPRPGYPLEARRSARWSTGARLDPDKRWMLLAPVVRERRGHAGVRATRAGRARARGRRAARSTRCRRWRCASSTPSRR